MILCAGIPATVIFFSNTSLTTTAFAPITHPLSTVTFPITLQPEAKKTLSPIVGASPMWKQILCQQLFKFFVNIQNPYPK